MFIFCEIKKTAQITRKKKEKEDFDRRWSRIEMMQERDAPALSLINQPGLGTLGAYIAHSSPFQHIVFS